VPIDIQVSHTGRKFVESNDTLLNRPYGSIVFAQQSQNTRVVADPSNQTTNASPEGSVIMINKTALLKPGDFARNTALLDAKMVQLQASNKPQDIATVAYIWGVSTSHCGRKFQLLYSQRRSQSRRRSG
jgi:hypothetical protein